jgi:hydrogenase expression/formation protein HypE
MLVIIAPTCATEEELINVIDQASDAARKLGVYIVGGHTEVSDSVNRFVLITTALGFTDNATVVKSSGAKVGDSILMTKYAGLEGTAILAADFGDRLSGLIKHEELEKAKSLIENISVVDEGVLCGSLKVNAMHDATEGGIMGGVWEMAEAGEVGCSIDLAKIPILPETKAICNAFELDPYKLISSGCMLISTERAEEVIETLKANNIFCTEIGKIVEKNRTYNDLNGQINELSAPQADELYKIT